MKSTKNTRAAKVESKPEGEVEVEEYISLSQVNGLMKQQKDMVMALL